MSGQVVRAKRLSSGFFHLRGEGPCNWSQPDGWTPEAVRAGAFCQASEPFLLAAERFVSHNPPPQ